ncbi:MAG: sulfatase [Anaerolineaceae bacterium]|nr:sulfatase [Anaerolineaceae bacterium]MDE0329018.1 sulfatase [Anaerolineaceae bacterium]
MSHPPNFLFIMSDDHAAHAMSCYGSRINRTPNLDRIADGGMRFDNCFCTNSICTPSRAAILTGAWNHVNGVTTLATHMDNRLPTFVKTLQAAGWQTGIFGKWHLGTGPAHCPDGFDDWAVLPGQGIYHNPTFIFRGPDGGQRRVVEGYTTDIITDMCLDWLGGLDRERPFMLMCHHKAPHRPWVTDDAHASMFLNEDVLEPDTLQDDYSERAAAAAAAQMRVGVHMNDTDIKAEMPRDLPEAELRSWAYQRYIKDYLRVVAGIDDNVGRLLDWLDEHGLAEDTVVVYTSDQGFFLGDHGWYDKRFMYEESLRMPLAMRYPRGVEAGSVSADMVLNVDFAPTFLELAGLEPDFDMQGRSFASVLAGDTPSDWRQSFYYRYWMHRSHHNVFAHYGVRTHRHKLIYYYADGLGHSGSVGERHEPEWELFDLQEDPAELRNIVDRPDMAGTVTALKDELHRLQAEVGDQRYQLDRD